MPISRLTFWDYRHHALVATVRTEEPHQATARQIFPRRRHSGVPAVQRSAFGLYRLVGDAGEAERLKRLEPEQFNHELAMTFDMRLGGLQPGKRTAGVPVDRRYARSFAAHRLRWWAMRRIPCTRLPGRA